MGAAPSTFGWRLAVLVVLLFGSLVGLMLHAPIPQDLHYHEFADRRGFLGIPNFLDVASNVPFLFVGLAGLRFLRQHPEKRSRSWVIFFVGVALVCFGSGYYHWAPSNQTLVWDRLPMTIAFMGLFVALIAESMDARWERRLLGPALLLGAASVIYWQFTDDLRLYAWVQFGPLLVIPVLLALYPGRYTHRWLIFVALGGYLLAKVLEMFDAPIFALTHQLIAGHAPKHLAAAAACSVLLEMVKRRQAVTGRTAGR